ncbi:MAG: lipopolysaccharide biosynthesis protein [Nitrospira sp.]|nr:lipopolysaccharide biosynthesis protein [Nitrospira sp.]
MKFGRNFSLFLLSSLIQGAISFAMVPIATYVLGPEEFGMFALISVIPVLLTVVATMGADYLFAKYYPTASLVERQRMVSTILAVGGTLLALGSSCLLAGWTVAVQFMHQLQQIPLKLLGLSLLSMGLGFPWVVASYIVTLDGKASLHAFITISQALVSALVIIIGLYGLGLGVEALFWGAIGTSIVSSAGAWVVLKPYARPAPSRMWAANMLRVGIPVSVANLMETLQSFLERYLLTAFAGLHALGLYAHSQQYRHMVSMPLKSVSRAIWPITLHESREERNQFGTTRDAWDMSYIGVTMVGLLFATLGGNLIGFLTHGKFVEAAPLVAMWMVFILVQNSGKPQTGVLYARGQLVACSKVMILSAGAGMVLMALLIPVIGMLGAIVAAIVQQVLYRVGIQLRASELEGVPRHDKWVMVGAGMVLATQGLTAYFSFGSTGNLIVFLIVASTFAIMAQRVIWNSVLNITAWLSAPRQSVYGQAVDS